MSTVPTTPSDPQAMPLADLKQAAGLNDPQPQPVAQPAPAPAPVVPEPFSVQQDDSGITIQMSPDFGGEVFKGKDWAEVGPKIAKAKADANAYIKQLKAQPPSPNPAPTVPEPPPVDPAVQATRDWLLAEQAAALGMSVDEYKARVQMVFQTTDAMATNLAIADFHKMCPGYVDTPENSQALQSYFADDFDHFPTAHELKQAYALAVLDGKIKPTDPSATASTPARPVPMPTAGASPVGGDQNPWTMPMDQLKKAALG